MFLTLYSQDHLCSRVKYPNRHFLGLSYLWFFKVLKICCNDIDHQRFCSPLCSNLVTRFAKTWFKIMPTYKLIWQRCCKSLIAYKCKKNLYKIEFIVCTMGISLSTNLTNFFSKAFCKQLLVIRSILKSLMNLKSWRFNSWKCLVSLTKMASS